MRAATAGKEEVATGPKLDQLYSSEVGPVFSFLYRQGARGADLEDLVHDTFATAVKRWGSYDPRRPVRPWILGIAFHVWSDSRRRVRMSKEVGGQQAVMEAVAASDDLEAGAMAREASALVDQALGKLDPVRRAVFVMHELEGLTATEISEAMGTPLPTVYSRLRVAREKFAAAVRRLQLHEVSHE